MNLELFFQSYRKVRQIERLEIALARINNDQTRFEVVMQEAEDLLDANIIDKYKDRMKTHLKNEIINLKREMEIELSKFKITKL